MFKATLEFKFIKLKVPYKFIRLLLRTRFITSKYFIFDRAKSVYSDFSEDLMNNVVDQSFKVNNSSQWEVWIDREFISLGGAGVTDVWDLSK
jgi:hypothetical protein